MQKFTVHKGLVAPMDRENVDTDAIIPKQFLKSIKRSGFGPNAFDEWRYMDVGEPGQECSQRPKNPNFVLNQARYQGAQVLLTRANFGCGSSREHAPWALEVNGIDIVIGESFARIFRQNMYNCGMIAAELPGPTLDELFAAFAGKETALAVDVAARKLSFSAPGVPAKTVPFVLGGFELALVEAGGWVEYAAKNY